MLKLTASKREPGKDLDAMRNEGKTPAVFYGSKTDSTPITLNTYDFINIWREAGESSVITLAMDGNDVDVLIQEVALDPVTDKPIHVDFYAIDKTKKVTVSIPVEFIGESPAVKNLGGTIVKVLHEIEIEGLPTILPHNISVDISTLTDLDSHIAIKDLDLPEGVVSTADASETIASITVKKEEEEESPSEEPNLENIEVEQKGKKDDGGGNSENMDSKDS